jgi:hypothetical protein
MMNTSLGTRERNTNTFLESNKFIRNQLKRTYFDELSTPYIRNGLPHIPSSKILNLEYDPSSAQKIPTKRKYIREKLFIVGKNQSIKVPKKSLTLPRISNLTNHIEEIEPIKKLLMKKN